MNFAVIAECVSNNALIWICCFINVGICIAVLFRNFRTVSCSGWQICRYIWNVITFEIACNVAAIVGIWSRNLAAAATLISRISTFIAFSLSRIRSRCGVASIILVAIPTVISAGVTSIALTKLDGTAKGGIVIAVSDALQIPVKFVGVGEQPDDLMPFEAQGFVDALL